MDQDTEKEFLQNIATAICNTRNEIAHAKANYTPKQLECPYKEREQFCQMLEIVAVKAIRWFALQPEEKRTVGILKK